MDDPFKAGTFHPTQIGKPDEWTKTPRCVATCLMGDMFHPDVYDKHLLLVFDKIIENATLEKPSIFIIVTKWPERADSFFSSGFGKLMRMKALGLGVEWPIPNMWFLVSCENQIRYNERVRHLENIPAIVRGVSMEPLLGNIDIGNNAGEFLDWVIVGGESGGSGTRPMHPSWPVNILRQCKEMNIPFFFKQWGSWSPENNDSERFSYQNKPDWEHTYGMNGIDHSGKSSFIDMTGKVSITAVDFATAIYPVIQMFHYHKRQHGLLSGFELKEFPIQYPF